MKTSHLSGPPKIRIFVAQASLPASFAKAGWKPALLPATVNRRTLSFLAAAALVVLTPGRVLALSTQTQDKLVQLISGLDDKVADLRQQGTANPQLGLNKIADSLEARVKVLKNSNYKEGTTLFSDAAAYVSVGNAIAVTPNFFSDTYSDAERQAILLHESVHLDQSLWEKKLKFWGTRGETDAYKEEYKWLNVLGVGAGSKDTKYEIFNVLQGLREDYGVISADDKTQALDQELGLTKEQLDYFNTGKVPTPVVNNPPPPPTPVTPKPPVTPPQPPQPPVTTPTNTGTTPAVPAKLLDQGNKFFSFRIPDNGWKVSYGDAGGGQERYVYLIKEAEKKTAGGGAIVVTYGVRITLGEVIGADYVNPGVAKVRDNELSQAKQWNFSGAEQAFSTFTRTVAGTEGLGYVKNETSKDGAGTKTLVTSRLYFKSGTKYYFIEQFYDTVYQDQIVGDAGVFIDSLQVKN